jgi:hypothetical protein
LVGTYYSLRGNLNSTLMLNNKGVLPLDVTPTFFSRTGTRLDLPPLTVNAASYREVDLGELLANAGNEFKEGNLRMTYQGMPLQLGSQVKILDERHSLIWDEQFYELAAKFVSSRLESVWWIPSADCQTKFVLSNTTDAPVTASVKVDGTSPNQNNPVSIQLNPHQTRVLDIMRDLVGNEVGNLQTKGGISISHSGEAGAVLARMLISDADAGFSSSVTFVDPQMTASKKWHGAGLHLGKVNGENLRQILVARNTSDAATIVNGKINYTDTNGNIVSVTVPDTEIAAHLTRTINLRQILQAANVPASVKFAGLEFNYTAPQGSVWMAAVSVSPDNNQVFQVPLYDPQKTPSSAGGYPWKTDGDYTTILYIKNDTAQPQQYIARMVYQGGFYMLGLKDIKVGETVAIDFRELRDNLTPDSMGNRIPLNVGKGQILWSSYGAAEHTLNGRSEQISLATGMSATYDCRNCCTDSTYGDSVSPGSTDADVGGWVNFIEVGHVVNCFNQSTPIFFTSGNWTSSNSAVAIIGSDGSAQAMSPGMATITDWWTNNHWYYSGVNQCSLASYPGNGSGNMMVRPKVMITPFEAVGKGSTFSVSVQVTGNNNNIPITLRLTKIGGTGESQFSNNGSTIQIFQSGNVQIKGIIESSTKDNYIIETIINNQVQTSSTSKDTFSIAKIKISRTIGNQLPTEVTDLTTDTIVGERIYLTAQVLPAGITIVKPEWTIPEKIVKDFTVLGTTGGPVLVTDLNSPTVSFVWVNGGGAGLESFVAKQVEYAVKIDNILVKGKSIFNVKRPYGAVTTVTPNHTAIDSAGGMLQIRLGRSNGKANDVGINFNATAINFPSAFPGDIEYVQMIPNSSRQIFDVNGTVVFTDLQTNALDGTYPYDTINKREVDDSPFQGVPPAGGGFRANVNDSFSMWLMFKPSGVGSVWVPLKKVDWQWQVSASSITGAWVITPPTVEPSNPTGDDTTDYPTWSSVAFR